jgi:hypothetical protein
MEVVQVDTFYGTENEIWAGFGPVGNTDKNGYYAGNALARVQRVHEPADLWDITICTQ